MGVVKDCISKERLGSSWMARSYSRLKSNTLNTTPVPSPIPVLTMAFEMHRSVCRVSRRSVG